VPELTTIFTVAAVGALLLLDNKVLFQAMLSRPLVTGAIFDCWFGCYNHYPLMVGAMLELVWANVIPGEPRRPSATFLGVLSASVIVLWPGDWTQLTPLQTTAILYLIVICGIPCSIVSQTVTNRVKCWTPWLNPKFADAISAGKFHRLFWLNLVPVPVYWLYWFLELILSIPLVLIVVGYLSRHLTDTSFYGLTVAALTFPLLGLSVFARIFSGGYLKRYMFTGFVIALIIKLIRPNIPPLVPMFVLLALGVCYLTAKRMWRARTE